MTELNRRAPTIALRPPCASSPATSHRGWSKVSRFSNAGNEVGSRWQHRADQQSSLRVEQHAMTGIADTNGEDHVSEKGVANYEVDRPDGGALGVINNWNRDVEDASLARGSCARLLR